MTCPKCGKEIKENAKFCSNCGTKLETVEQESKENLTESPQDDEEQLSKKKKTKRNLLIICGCVILIGIVITIAIVFPSQNITVTGISLAGYNDGEMIVSKTLELQPIFSPIGETAKVKYSSDNESVAVVDENGVITAIGEGNAVITATVSDTIYDTVTIAVLEDTPYNRLSENERTVVDLVSKISYQFKNPDSINVTAVSKVSVFDNYSCVEVCISAQNGFGGYASSYYLITDDNGKLEMTNMDDYYAVFATYNPIENIDIEGINEALKDKI